MPILVWFRRDIRIADNAALSAAAKDCAGRGVIPFFVFDPQILSHPHTGAASAKFMLGCLAELDERLKKAGGRLLLLRGNPHEAIARLLPVFKPSALYFNKDYAPDSIERDARVVNVLSRAGVKARSFKDQVIFEEHELLSSSQAPYTMFTPYKNAWRKNLEEVSLFPSPRLTFPQELKGFELNAEDAETIDMPSERELGLGTAVKLEIEPGESAGKKLLNGFMGDAISQYAKNRDNPALEHSTSRLSPHLRHGSVSVRQALLAAMENPTRGAETWITQLVWREFYQQILFHFPHVQEKPFKPRWNGFPWRTDDHQFELWKTGRTGFPLIDAAMRQLWQTGWMHNRLRMITANFLTRDLLIDYHWGETWFMKCLCDGEIAQNNGGWQWCAGAGTDPQPWFRIFNPTSQSQKHDPRGLFIRKWIPELNNTPDEYIHTPWLAPLSVQKKSRCVIGEDYPHPILHHPRARMIALEAFKKHLYKNDESRQTG